MGILGHTIIPDITGARPTEHALSIQGTKHGNIRLKKRKAASSQHAATTPSVPAFISPPILQRVIMIMPSANSHSRTIYARKNHRKRQTMMKNPLLQIATQQRDQHQAKTNPKARIHHQAPQKYKLLNTPNTVQTEVAAKTSSLCHSTNLIWKSRLIYQIPTYNSINTRNYRTGVILSHTLLYLHSNQHQQITITRKNTFIYIHITVYQSVLFYTDWRRV